MMSDYCRDMFVEFGFVSGSVRRSGLNVVTFVLTCSARSTLFRDEFVEVGLGSLNVRRGWAGVGTCSAMSS